MTSTSFLTSGFSPLRRGRSAFTLIELLVVLSLIVLALAAAVPAFNYITGSRSTDAAQNIISATLQRARAQAIQSNSTIGVAFFVNPADGRATMGLVAVYQESPYYRGWTNYSYQENSSGTGVVLDSTKYSLDQRAIALYMQDTFSGSPPAGTNYTDAERYRAGVNLFAYEPNPSVPGNAAPPQAPWQTESFNIDFLTDVPFETLPANIAVQTINDPKGLNRDHYLQTGVILFDAQGRTISIPYAFRYGSQIYNLLAKSGTTTPLIPQSTNAQTTLYSQLGIVIYDRSAFLNQSGATEGDPAYQIGGVAGGTDLLQLTGPTTAGPEGTEESWLDKNATPLFVNRGNGTLLKGQ